MKAFSCSPSIRESSPPTYSSTLLPSDSGSRIIGSWWERGERIGGREEEGEEGEKEWLQVELSTMHSMTINKQQNLSEPNDKSFPLLTSYCDYSICSSLQLF